MSDRPTPPEMPPFEGEASDDLVEILLATEALAPDELEALRALVRSDADRNARARTLGATEERLHAELEAALPDRSLLVLLALDTAGRRDLLDEADFARLEHARPALDDVLTSFPGLRLVLLRIAGDAAVFEACWAEEERIEDRARVDRPAQPHARTLRPLWRIGVGLAVVAFAAVSVVLLRRDQGLVTVTARAPETVALGDGTSIRLTRGAVLRYARPNGSGAEARRVRLSGDAYFDVAPGEAPFQVQTPTARVSVLGTVFGVRATMAETEVTLVEGALTVQAGGAMVRLSPGEQSRVVRGAAPSSPAPVEVSRALAWSGLFVFRNTPLAEALTQLAERHGVQLTTTEALRAQQVTGTFEVTQPLSEILDAVALTLGAQVERTEQGYRIG